jgi:tripartite-type tricarboxylate transporter receptor subunit TctC
MKTVRRINALVLTFAMVFACLIGAQASMAATYPDHPIKLMVGFPPGGPAGTVSAIIAKRVSEFMEQPMVVEYKPGGGGTLAATQVAKAKPDGYTLLTGTDSPIVIAPLITRDLLYTMDDFTSIVGYSTVPVMLNVKKGRWNSLQDMIADAKKNPGKITFSTQSANSYSHFIVKILEERAGINLKMVPFPGVAEATTALLGGHIDLAVVATGTLYQAGRIDILACAEKKRLKDYPNVPTLNELGYPIFYNGGNFLLAPKGIPKEIINKLNDYHQKAFAKYGDEIAATFKNYEMYPAFLSADELAEENKARRDAFRIVAKNMGILVPDR